MAVVQHAKCTWVIVVALLLGPASVTEAQSDAVDALPVRKLVPGDFRTTFLEVNFVQLSTTLQEMTAAEPRLERLQIGNRLLEILLHVPPGELDGALFATRSEGETNKSSFVCIVRTKQAIPLEYLSFRSGLEELTAESSFPYSLNSALDATLFSHTGKKPHVQQLGAKTLVIANSLETLEEVNAFLLSPPTTRVSLASVMPATASMVTYGEHISRGSLLGKWTTLALHGGLEFAEWKGLWMATLDVHSDFEIELSGSFDKGLGDADGINKDIAYIRETWAKARPFQVQYIQHKINQLTKNESPDAQAFLQEGSVCLQEITKNAVIFDRSSAAEPIAVSMKTTISRKSVSKLLQPMDFQAMLSSFPLKISAEHLSRHGIEP